MTKYKYEPGYMDQYDPKVIEGYPIKPGAIVTVTKKKVDPIGIFVFIQDENGNRQSVYKKAIVRVKH